MTAAGAVIIDADTGKVLWSKDPDTMRCPASTTKIMTALLMLELLSVRGVKLSEILEPLRAKYFISGEINSEVTGAQRKMDELEAHYGAMPGATVTLSRSDGDGVVALPSATTDGTGAFAMTLEGDAFVRVGDSNVTAPAARFTGPDVHALAGIGHPQRFFAQLAAMGIAATPHPFPDHHRFAPADLAIAGARAILMTEKDALKCEAFADERCWYLPVRARVDDALVALIGRRLDGSQAA